MQKVCIFASSYIIQTEMENNINTQSMLPVGTTLQGGKYRIERYLASGGFGNTYVVVNTAFDETFAMKEFFMKDCNLRNGHTVTVSIPDKRSFFEANREKFVKEARRLRKLHNEHLVGVHDLFEENGTAYYVMDFIKGESLKARLNRLGQPMTEAEVMPLLLQALDVLEVIHREQIWHLDIKPDNFMVDANGRLYLIDFGASKQLHSVDGRTLATSAAMALTLGYAPLEQMEQNLRFCGPWTDLYALGATLYKLLTLQSIPSATELLYGALLTLPSTLSLRMQQLITWMMKPIKDQRPQSAAEVRAFLNSKVVDNDETFVGELPENPEEVTQVVGGSYDDGKKTIYVPYEEYKKRQHQQSAPNEEIITVRGVSFKMVRVEGGTFTMGATSEQGSDAFGNERPAHQVTLSTFSIGETEVTQELWQAVMGSNPSNFKGAKRPVEQVSWEDCQNFIRELNSLTGRRFRLPTEAEWEYAARGGNKSNGYKYSGSSDIDKVAWYDVDSEGETFVVATKQPNELGLYDMSGNVWEWCQDWYGSYSSGSQTNPTGASSGSNRVRRGGSWRNGARYCRVSNRRSDTPSDRYYDLGLRLAF